jgi:hypothetical protein
VIGISKQTLSGELRAIDCSSALMTEARPDGVNEAQN